MADLDLQIVLKAILDAKGFEQAQVAIKGLASTANNSAPPIEGLGEKSSDLTKTLGGTRGGVADLTRVLLMNIGVTGPAGEVAKAAGVGMNFMGAAATGLSLGVAGLVAAVALLLPKIVEWLDLTGKQSEKQRELLAAIKDGLPDLTRYRDTITEMSSELRALLDLQDRQASDKQKKDIEDLTSRQGELRSEIERLDAATTGYVENLGKGEVIVHGAREATQKEIEERHKLSQEYADNEVSLNALMAAQADETTIAGQAEAAARRLREEEERRRQAVDELTAALDRQASRELAQAQEVLDEQAAAGKFRDDQAKDAEKDMGEQSRREQATLKTRLEQDAELARQQGLNEEEIARLVQRQETAKVESRNAAFAAGIGALSAFFGKSKALAIAAAIADTYAAATAALGMKPWTPINFAMAAAVIAQGLANVANIRKAEAGFDIPANDALAQAFGEKWGRDLLQHMDIGVRRAASVTNVYNQTTVNRGTTVQGGMHLGGFFGTNKTEFLKRLNRDLTTIARLEKRTTL